MTRLVSGDAQPFEGQDKALRPQTLAEFGYPVAGWSRTPREIPGVESFSGQDALPAFLARTRFLVTIAALTMMGPLGEPQMRLTVQNALSAGATQREIAEVIWQMSMFGGLPATQKALEIARAVFTDTEEKPE